MWNLFTHLKAIVWRRIAFPETLLKTRKQVLDIVQRWVMENGWKPVPFSRSLRNPDFLVKKHGVVIAIFCAGTDHKLKITNINDIKNFTRIKRETPIFIYGEEEDPRLPNYVDEGYALIRHVSLIGSLETDIASLSPTMKGLVDRIVCPRILSGWVRLSCGKPAGIIAYRGRKIVGQCIADQYRGDLKKIGAPNCAFEIAINEDMAPREMVDEIEVKVFFQGRLIGVLTFWKNIIVKNIDGSLNHELSELR